MVQKDYTTPPNQIAHSFNMTIPLPVWDQHKGGIQPCRDSSGADNVAVDCYPCVRENCVVIRHQMPSAPMSRYVSSRENTGRPTQQRSSAYREQDPFVLNVPANEPEYLLVVHERLLSVTTGYKQHVK